jgi:FtsP/CotA-like multicopper oxidase with cupredoxin domain
MKKTVVPITAAAVLLALPTGVAWAASGPSPRHDDSSAPVASASVGSSGLPALTPQELLKLHTTPTDRRKAARAADLKGRPAQVAGGVSMADVTANGPDYFGNTPNYANSPLPRLTWVATGAGHAVNDPVRLPIFDVLSNVLLDPVSRAVVNPSDSPFQVDAITGLPVLDPINHLPQIDYTKVNVAGGIRKFVQELPTDYVATAVPDTSTYPNTDNYVIGLKEYSQTFSPDLPATKLRGYYQVNAPAGSPAANPSYLGPLIKAQAGRPVRVTFVNTLKAGGDGDLFLPVDTTAMGAGTGPDGATLYSSNRASVHLNGGLTPWISDGTPHQWTTPVGDAGKYPKGVSVMGVPDMPAIQTVNASGTKIAGSSDGTLTFYYTNDQSARLMWYHDDTYGLTRLNVYAGEAAPYLLSDSYEQGLQARGVLPDGVGGGEGIPLILQDKGFVPDENPSGYFPDGQLINQDPTWKLGQTAHGWGGTGALWFPHVYMPNQNPYIDSGTNAMGRWDYGPWFWPIFGTSAGLIHGEVANPWAPGRAWEAPMIPGTPSTYTFAKGLATSDSSLVPDAFVDTPVVNGVVYPYMKVDAKAYRFRLLNGSNDRYWNLQMYCSAADKPNAQGVYNKVNGADMWLPGAATPQNPAAGEVPMVPANKNNNYPKEYPKDGRAGGIPDPAARAGQFLQIGSDSGVLPAAVDLRNGPVTYDMNRRGITVLNVLDRALWLGPSERADVVYDFSTAANMGCKNVILYNDAPAPVPMLDPRNDYYTNDPDQTSTGGAPTTIPGFGPNTRTVMQFRINGVTTGTPATATPWNSAPLRAEVPAWFAATQPMPVVPAKGYADAYPNDPIGQSDVYAKLTSYDLSWNHSAVGELTGLTLTNPGSGYAPTATVTGGGGTGAVVTPVISAVGTVQSVTIVNRGTGYTSPPTITIVQPNGGVAATATATIRAGGLRRITVTNGGTKYTTGATVTFGAPASGSTATATATVNQVTGSLSGLTLTDPGNGYAAAPTVDISAPPYGGALATASVSLATGTQVVTVPPEPKTIQELFEMNYGRYNYTFGVELPKTNALTQTTLPMIYTEPTTEFLKPTQAGSQIGTTRNGTAIWRITHNGLVTHTVHFHLVDVQVINRVGWDGSLRPPDPGELGWKDSVKVNPLEDTFVAIRPITPELPFKVPNSVRPVDPTLPLNAQMAALDPVTGQAIIYTNSPKNMGWEYLWNGTPYGHEVNDEKRVVDFAGSPTAPSNVTASLDPTTKVVTLAWRNTANWQLTNFVVERATNAAFTGSVQTLSSKPGTWQGTVGLGATIAPTTTSWTDDLSTMPAGPYYYRVRAESANGFSDWGARGGRGGAAKSVSVVR